MAVHASKQMEIVFPRRKTLQRNYDSLMEKFCSAAELEWKLNQHFPEEIH